MLFTSEKYHMITSILTKDDVSYIHAVDTHCLSTNVHVPWDAYSKEYDIYSIYRILPDKRACLNKHAPDFLI